MAEKKDNTDAPVSARATSRRKNSDLRAAMSLFLEGKLKEVQKTWEGIVDKKTKIELYLKMCDVALPKLSTMSVDATVNKTSYEDKLKEITKGVSDQAVLKN